ncbi:MAG: alpha/beta hydrolase [Clostridia bacterium]|nr:alpha/beta hydrolase [Clostridia bacterium]
MKNGSVMIGQTDMDYAAFGGGKKNLVVLPGLSDGLATVKGKALLLAPAYRRFFDAFRVYMFSRKNEMPEGYTIRQMAEDQAAALKALGIDKASVLGVSQGGMIAQYLAADHPEMIDKLVLAVTASYTNEVVKRTVESWIEMAKAGDHVSLMTDTAEKMYSKAYLEKNRRLFPIAAKLTKPESYERFFRNAYAILGFDAREVLPGVHCPTFIIAGADDNTVGKYAADELHKLIPHSQLFTYEGLGHGAFEEARDFYDKVYEFCAAE